MGSSAEDKRALSTVIVWVLAATAFVLVLATRPAIAQAAEPGVSTSTTRSSVPSAEDIHPTTIAGIPGLIAIPDPLVSSTPIVVMYHGFGPPSSPEALAKAVPPIPGAISFYPWLPLFGARMDAGGKSDLVQRQADDYVGRLLFPVMAQAAAELPTVIHDLTALYHLSNRRPIVIFGSRTHPGKGRSPVASCRTLTPFMDDLACDRKGSR